tara:strand:+ start:357 stop:1214 length:858 start_codon:yes stop_codon:yes gene_type:complete
MLAIHTCSKWTGRKKDKAASATVTSQNYAAKGVASVSKMLLGESPALMALTKHASNARNLHYSMTLPWDDLGNRMLPSASYFRYHEVMTDMQNEFNRMVDDFLQSYTWEVSRAQARLGDLFEKNDYPSADSLRSKFAFRVDYATISDPDDFRVKIGDESAAILKEHMNNYHNKRFDMAMDNLWKRVHTAVANMSERLRVGEDDERVSKTGSLTFNDSLVGNVLDMVDLLGTCNVTGDSKQEAIRRQLEDTLNGVTADGLRHSSLLRAETKASIDDIILNLPSLDL